MTLAKDVATHLAQKHSLHENVGSRVNASLYRMIVGSLQYLTLTKPDITHVVNLASQFMQSSNIEHLRGVKKILIYIKGSMDIQILIGEKQSTVARSSVEAEYRALASTIAEMTWIMYLLHDLGVFLRSVPTLYCDNLSALYIKVNPVMHARTKHVEMNYHFVREKVVRRQLLT
ncbi:hypothetical protein KY285_012950 [Solanum tuberosum]|nr:hypothetical protein KY285_012950 [Solanum tuberosum]